MNAMDTTMNADDTNTEIRSTIKRIVIPSLALI
jgi:hypothetical protein